MEKLNNPTILFGKKDTPYCITFEDYNGSSILGGGISCIQGYIYSNDKWGFQLHTKFVGIPKYRQKFDGVWSSFTGLFPNEGHALIIFTFSSSPTEGGAYVTNTMYVPQNIDITLQNVELIGHTGNYVNQISIERNGSYVYLHTTGNFAGLTASCIAVFDII